MRFEDCRLRETMRKLRERLRKEILVWEHSGSVQHAIIEELNNLMAEHPMRTRLNPGRKIVRDRTMVRTAQTGRFVWSAGAQCGDIIRDCGSQARPQVCPVRVAFP